MPKRAGLAGETGEVGTMKVIILHGWTTSKEKWVPFLQKLDKKYQLQVLDIPVLTSKSNRSWTLDDYVSWLKDILDKEMQVILIGHSNGGRIALRFASMYSQKVLKLILIDSAGIYHNELYLKLKRLFWGTIAKAGKGVKENSILRKIFYKIIGEGDYKDADQIQRQTMTNLIAQDLTQILDKIAVPTLIIWGGEDKITPLKDGQLMHKKIKGSILNIIQEAGHSPHFSHTGEVVKQIEDFIKT